MSGAGAPAIEQSTTAVIGCAPSDVWTYVLAVPALRRETAAHLKNLKAVLERG